MKGTEGGQRRLDRTGCVQVAESGKGRKAKEGINKEKLSQSFGAATAPFKAEDFSATRMVEGFVLRILFGGGPGGITMARAQSSPVYGLQGQLMGQQQRKTLTIELDGREDWIEDGRSEVECFGAES